MNIYNSVGSHLLRILAGLSNSFLTGNVYMADTAPNHPVASFKQIEVTSSQQPTCCQGIISLRCLQDMKRSKLNINQFMFFVRVLQCPCIPSISPQTPGSQSQPRLNPHLWDLPGSRCSRISRLLGCSGRRQRLPPPWTLWRARCS